MTHEEAKAKAVEKLFIAIAHMNDYEDDEIEEHLGDAVMFITEGVIQALKKKENNTHPLVRVKTMPEVRQKGWDDAIQTAVRLIDEFIEHEDMSYGKKLLEHLRNNVKGLECL